MPGLQFCTDAIFILYGKSTAKVARDPQSSIFIRDSQKLHTNVCATQHHTLHNSANLMCRRVDIETCQSTADRFCSRTKWCWNVISSFCVVLPASLKSKLYVPVNIGNFISKF
jgi:hypothetical protein